MCEGWIHGPGGQLNGVRPRPLLTSTAKLLTPHNSQAAASLFMSGLKHMSCSYVLCCRFNSRVRGCKITWSEKKKRVANIFYLQETSISFSLLISFFFFTWKNATVWLISTRTHTFKDFFAFSCITPGQKSPNRPKTFSLCAALMWLLTSSTANICRDIWK